MELIKVLRLRATEVQIEERLGSNVGTGGFKGGVTDVRLEVYVESVTSTVDGKVETWEDYQLKFIELFKLVAPNTAPTPDPEKKYSNYLNAYGDTREQVLDFILSDFIFRNAYNLLISHGNSMTVAETKSRTYYQIIQDPWLDEPPLQRNFGVDPYFLNNQSRIQIFWHLPTTSPVSFYSQEYGTGLTSGVFFSNEDGTESYNRYLTLPGKTPSFPYQDEDDIKYAKDEKKKINKSLMAYDKSDSKQLFVLSSNDIKVYGTASEPDVFPGDTTDLDLINKFIEIWKKKVPNYDLKLNEPNYLPTGGTLSFKDPTITESAEESPVDNKTPEQKTPDEVKFKLSVIFDKTIKIKAGQDMPEIKIYVGDPPKEGEFAFEETDDFEDSSLLDDEYVEDEFKGLDAILLDLSQKYVPPDNKVDEVDQGNDPDRGSDGSSVTYIEGVSTGAGGNNNNEKVKSALKKATDATGGGGSGRCARYTFNHANNFVKALIGKSLTKGATTPAGGNANQASYHNALVKLGYTKKETVTLTKAELKKTLETASNWDLGDVVAYWGISTALASKSGVQYGHTQIFTNGVHGSSNKWTSDNFGNFNCAFVYNGYKVDTWKLVILKSPTAGKKIA